MYESLFKKVSATESSVVAFFKSSLNHCQRLILVGWCFQRVSHIEDIENDEIYGDKTNLRGREKHALRVYSRHIMLF